MTAQPGDIAAIRQLAEDWRAGWLAGDVDALLALYADDPVVMPWGRPAVFGKEAIRALYEPVFRDYTIRSEERVMEVEVSGGLGYFWVSYHLRAAPKGGGAPLEEDGKAVFIVRRVANGVWKIARLIDNSDRALAGS